MRISDWSSDVCSSDLHPATSRKLRGHILEGDSVMGSLSIWHWLIVLAIVILVFGTKKLRNAGGDLRSEEHTSELQSLMRISYAVFCLKKKTLPNTTGSISNASHTRDKVLTENLMQQNIQTIKVH